MNVKFNVKLSAAEDLKLDLIKLGMHIIYNLENVIDLVKSYVDLPY